MTNFVLNNIYNVSDFNGLTNLETGVFTLSSSATPLTANVTDDDPTLQDSSNSPTSGQTVDSTQEYLTSSFKYYAAGTPIYSRATAEAVVTQPDGKVFNVELIQLKINGETHFEFQAPVQPGSTVNISTWTSGGDTAYSDLADDGPIVTYEFNQVISAGKGFSFINGTTSSINESELGSLFVNDEDAILEDSLNSGAQTLDQNVQALAQPYDTMPAGAYVYARGYYDVTDTTTGETGRMYLLRIDNGWDGLSTPGTDYEVFAFSNDFNVNDNSNIVVTSGLNGTGNIEHERLFVCFSKGTLITTSQGEIEIELLNTGDEVLNLDGEYSSIRWIGSRRFERHELEQSPELFPVRISAGSLGSNLPAKDLLVSRQHRMLARSKIAERLLGSEEVLLPAIKLTELPGIYVDESVDSVEYYHILFEEHEVIFANSTPSESLFSGPQALKSVGTEAREEIIRIFPEFALEGYVANEARPIPSEMKIVKNVVHRHAKKQVALVSESQ